MRHASREVITRDAQRLQPQRGARGHVPRLLGRGLRRLPHQGDWQPVPSHGLDEVCPPLPPSLPYKVDTSRPSLRTNWTRRRHVGVPSMPAVWCRKSCWRPAGAFCQVAPFSRLATTSLLTPRCRLCCRSTFSEALKVFNATELIPRDSLSKTTVPPPTPVRAPCTCSFTRPDQGPLAVGRARGGE